MLFFGAAWNRIWVVVSLSLILEFWLCFCSRFFDPVAHLVLCSFVNSVACSQIHMQVSVCEDLGNALEALFHASRDGAARHSQHKDSPEAMTCFWVTCDLNNVS